MPKIKSVLVCIFLYFIATSSFSEELHCRFNPKYVWPMTNEELKNWPGDKELQDVRLIRSEEGLHDVILVSRSTKDLIKTLFYDVYDAEMIIDKAKYEGFFDSHRRTYFFTSSFNFSTTILVAKTGEAVLAESFGIWEGMCE